MFFVAHYSYLNPHAFPRKRIYLNKRANHFYFLLNEVVWGGVKLQVKIKSMTERQFTLRENLFILKIMNPKDTKIWFGRGVCVILVPKHGIFNILKLSINCANKQSSQERIPIVIMIFFYYFKPVSHVMFLESNAANIYQCYSYLKQWWPPEAAICLTWISALNHEPLASWGPVQGLNILAMD